MAAAMGSPGGLVVKGRWLILVTLCLAALIINLDTTIVNVALPPWCARSAPPPPACNGWWTGTR